MIEWIRFGVSAVLMLCGLAAFAFGLFGIYKFRFVMNRMHAAAICDTAGLFFVVLSLVVGRGFDAVNVKMMLIVGFFWLTGPISSHLIAKMEYYTDPDLQKEIKNNLNEVKGDGDDGIDNL